MYLKLRPQNVLNSFKKNFNWALNTHKYKVLNVVVGIFNLYFLCVFFFFLSGKSLSLTDFFVAFCDSRRLRLPLVRC